MARDDHRLAVFGFRGLLLSVAALGALATAGCTSDMHTYRDIMKGRTPCRCDPCGSWHEYGSIMRGETPCHCKGACECPAPSSCPTPCASPCSPMGCADLPAGAKPGEAWCRVVTPAVYETVTETVTSECARTQQVWVPPVYKTMVHRVLLEPAKTSDLPVSGATKSVATCEVVCPSRTTTCTHCEPDACGCPQRKTETCVIPAETCRNITDVCIEPPSRHRLDEPALYTAELCDVEVKPGYWVTVEIPPVHETVTRRVCKSPETCAWKRNESCVVPHAASTPVCTPATPTSPAPAK
jgi:hypothetical protein